MNYIRLKNTIPFSQRLNDWILERVKTINYKESNEDLGSFEDLKTRYKKDGYLTINNSFCENNIFGSKEVNIAFRAWHDLIHIELNEGFEYMQETRVAFKQIAELPEDWKEEKLLILSEIIGQAAYHEKTNSFVDNQRLFTSNLMQSGTI